ncbi:hypothetical protein, partial [Clostridium sardiniense]|uniref:hypothetical protein n=1 Tax=Clostridium sardiniense TaxID=29369 RepID=UPI001959AE46
MIYLIFFVFFLLSLCFIAFYKFIRNDYNSNFLYFLLNEVNLKFLTDTSYINESYSKIKNILVLELILFSIITFFFCWTFYLDYTTIVY